MIKINVTLCKLPNKDIKKKYILDDLCFLSLDGRLIGKEILHVSSNIIHSQYTNTTDYLPCYWQLTFENQVTFHGNYKLEIFTNWIHGFDEPSAKERARGKEGRVNDGVSKSLNGLGNHPFHVVNATKWYYDFTGYVLRGNSRSLYLINYNNTKQEFYDATTFDALGYYFGIE
jgi:hypothetical protein